MINLKNKCSGFTFVEILLVVAIIGILAAMVIPRLVGRSDEARTVAARADIDANLASALDLYEVDTGSHPKNEQGLEVLMTRPLDPKIAARWKGPYIKKRPLDPWGNPYVYRFPGAHG